MGRRGESIFHRKDGRWEARFPAGKNADGAVKYRSVYAKTYSEVKAKKTEALKNAVSTKTKSTILFSDVASKWLAEKASTTKEQTARNYCQCLDAHILPYFGNKKVSTITTDAVNSFLKSKQCGGRLDGSGGLSTNTVRGMSVLIQSIMDYAFANKLGVTQQIKIKKPRAERPPVSVLNRREQQKLDSILLENPHGQNLAVLLALHTGMRIGEICALRWDSIDLEERMLRVCASVARSSNGMPTIGSPKSKTSDRLIPISHKLTQLLKSEKMLASSDYVFAAPRNGSFLNPRTLQYHFRSLLEKGGLPLVKFHALRHTFATRWIECGMDVKMLSELLGHGSVQITLDIYVHSSDQRKREAIEKIELFSGQDSGQENAESVA